MISNGMSAMQIVPYTYHVIMDGEQVSIIDTYSLLSKGEIQNELQKFGKRHGLDWRKLKLRLV